MERDLFNFRCPKCGDEFPDRASLADAQEDHNLCGTTDCDGQVVEVNE